MAILNITVNIPTAGIVDLEDLRRRVTSYANKLIIQYPTTPTDKDVDTEGLYISERIKALETGFEIKGHLSDDYKEEIKERLSERYL